MKIWCFGIESSLNCPYDGDKKKLNSIYERQQTCIVLQVLSHTTLSLIFNTDIWEHAVDVIKLNQTN